MTAARAPITRALVLAEGVGGAPVPLTETTPAPLVEVAGRAPIDRVLDRLAAHGIAEAVVAVQRHRAQIEAHLARRTSPRIVQLREAESLGTGGTIRAALPRLGATPFLVAGTDSFWLDGTTPALDRLAAAWADATMDALLLVHRAVGAVGYDGPGEVFLDPLGRARLRTGNQVAPFAFAGVQILHPRLFAAAPADAFAIEKLWAQAEEAGRLFAVVNDGAWFHVATREAAAAAEEAIEGLGVWRRAVRHG